MTAQPTRDETGREGPSQEGVPLDALLTDAAVGSSHRFLPVGSVGRLAAGLGRQPVTVARHVGRLTGTLAAVGSGRAELVLARDDRRFSDPAWSRSWLFRRVMQSYLAAGHTVDPLIDDAGLDSQSEQRVRFALQNLLDALAPTNFWWSNPAPCASCSRPAATSPPLVNPPGNAKASYQVSDGPHSDDAEAWQRIATESSSTTCRPPRGPSGNAARASPSRVRSPWPASPGRPPRASPTACGTNGATTWTATAPSAEPPPSSPAGPGSPPSHEPTTPPHHRSRRGGRRGQPGPAEPRRARRRASAGRHPQPRPFLRDRRALLHDNVALFNYGKKPATVERVRLLDVTGPLELLGIRTRQLPSPDGYPIGAVGYPPTEYTSKPLTEDNVVPVPTTFDGEGFPDEHLQLVIGVRITAPGVASAQRIEVTYKVGRHRYREVIRNSIHLCNPAAEYEPKGGCPPRAAEGLTSDRTLG